MEDLKQNLRESKPQVNEDSPNDIHFSEKNLKVKIDKIETYTNESLIGSRLTSLAMKNAGSYLIGTSSLGIILIENGEKIYSETLPKDSRVLLDILYIEHLDRYLIDCDNQLLYKDIDEKPPYKFMDTERIYRIAASFFYSKINRRLIYTKDWKKVSMIDFRTKHIELEIPESSRTYIWDFKVFREKEDKVVAINKNGDVFLYTICYQLKKVLHFSHSKVRLQVGVETGSSMAVCNKNQYVLLALQNSILRICSKIVLLKIRGKSVTTEAILNQTSQKIEYQNTLECFGYLGGHIIWVGLSDGSGVAQVYDYDLEGGSLRELKGKREPHQEYRPVKMMRTGNAFFYTGRNGRVMRLTLTN